MEEEDRKPDLAEAVVLGAPLDDLSVDELEERISACESEIERVRKALFLKRDSQQAADAVFKI